MKLTIPQVTKTPTAQAKKKTVKSGPFLGEEGGVLVKFLLTAYFIKFTGKVICVDSLESNTTVTIIRQGAVNLS